MERTPAAIHVAGGEKLATKTCDTKTLIFRELPIWSRF
jgi:hypothetical protein